MLFRPGDNHGHPVGELFLLDGVQAPQPRQVAQPVSRFEEFRLQPLALGTLRSGRTADTAYRKQEGRKHHTPVENREGQSSSKAKKRQTLFFALVSLSDWPDFPRWEASEAHASPRRVANMQHFHLVTSHIRAVLHNHWAVQQAPHFGSFPD
jgi:hypothetical protein